MTPRVAAMKLPLTSHHRAVTGRGGAVVVLMFPTPLRADLRLLRGRLPLGVVLVAPVELATRPDWSVLAAVRAVGAAVEAGIAGVGFGDYLSHVGDLSAGDVPVGQPYRPDEALRTFLGGQHEIGAGLFVVSAVGRVRPVGQPGVVRVGSHPHGKASPRAGMLILPPLPEPRLRRCGRCTRGPRSCHSGSSRRAR